MATAETVDLSGLGQALSRACQPPQDYGPLMRQIATACAASYKRAFSESRDPDNVPWLPLKPATLKKRRKKGKGARILVDTAELMLSGATKRIGPLELVFGSNSRKASWHFNGTRTIPVRNAVGVGERLGKLIETMCADFVVQRMRG